MNIDLGAMGLDCVFGGSLDENAPFPTLLAGFVFMAMVYISP